jgi:hypothetical protein
MSLVSVFEYLTSDGIIVENRVELELIDKAEIELDIDIFMGGFSCKRLVEMTKIKYTDLVILENVP